MRVERCTAQDSFHEAVTLSGGGGGGGGGCAGCIADMLQQPKNDSGKHNGRHRTGPRPDNLQFYLVFPNVVCISKKHSQVNLCSSHGLGSRQHITYASCTRVKHENILHHSKREGASTSFYKLKNKKQ